MFTAALLLGGVGNSLEASVSVEVLKAAIERYGKPDIVSSDQGSQYTSKDSVGYLRSFKTDGREIKISMDGKGRATDPTTGYRPMWLTEQPKRLISRAQKRLSITQNYRSLGSACK